MNQEHVTVSARAVLTFGNGLGDKSSFSIPRARITKTVPEAQASMQAIIDSGALEFDKIGPAATIMGAKIVQTTRTRIV